jgi:transcriptional regulator with PAS, ATPase and Fis domain
MTDRRLKINSASGEITTDDFSRWNVVGKSPAFLCALGLIRKIASCDATVLIEGETGTGKELAARAIHYLSSRRDCPFIPVNCGALPEGLLENELYGHERGAFTDARESYAGIITQAQHGTLFLDEVESMSARGQVVLLRFLQDHDYRPVGGKRVYHADVRNHWSK